MRRRVAPDGLTGGVERRALGPGRGQTGRGVELLGPSWIAQRDPHLAVGGGQGQGSRASAGHSQRHAGLLHAPGDAAGVDGLVPLPLQAGRGRIGQELIELGHELLETTGSLGHRPRRLAHGRGIPPRPAGTDADGDAAGRHVVEGHDLLGQRHGMAEVGRGDERPQSQRGRRGGHRRQQGHGPEPRTVAQALPGEVVIGPRGVGAQRFGLEPHVARRGPGHRRQDDHAHSHDPTLGSTIGPVEHLWVGCGARPAIVPPAPDVPTIEARWPPRCIPPCGLGPPGTWP